MAQDPGGRARTRACGASRCCATTSTVSSSRDDAGRVTLIDMGLPGHGPKLLAALDSIGSSPGDVTRLLLTHAHPDHIGGAAHVARETGLGMGVHAGRRRLRPHRHPPPQVAVGLLGGCSTWSTPTIEPEPIPVARSSSTASCCRWRAGCGWCTCPGTPPATWASSTSRRACS